MTIRENDRIPHAIVHVQEDEGFVERSTAELFAGRTVVAFALPGAFTPTCSSAHVPGYQELAPRFFEHGVDAILCISVNDPFVMEAWQREQGADRLTFVADGNGDFTRAMGMATDKRGLGFGERSWRYSMLVEDGKVVRLFGEPDVPGDPFEVSDAHTMLEAVAPGSKAGEDIVLFTRPGCGHCRRAKAHLDERGIAYRAIDVDRRTLRAVSGSERTPQVFIDGALVGGADELARRYPKPAA